MSAIDAHALLAEIASRDRNRWLQAANIISGFDRNTEVDVSILVSSVTSPNDQVVFWSIIALEHLGEKGRLGIPLLISFLETKEFGLRQLAVKALAAIGPYDQAARSAVFASFKDLSPFVRRQALQACINLPTLSPRELETIAAMAADPDETVARWSEITLRNIRLLNSP